MKERIFIAGAYQPKNCSLHAAAQQVRRNVDKTVEIANRLIEKGHFVFVPLLSHYIHIDRSCKKDYGEWWYEEDNTFLDNWATAIFMADNWSKSFGAVEELERAKNLGLKIFYNLDEVEDDN